MIEDGAIVAAGFLADGAGQPALADASRPDKGEIVMGVDPFPLRKLLEQGAIETSGRREASKTSTIARTWRSPEAMRAIRASSNPLAAPICLSGFGPVGWGKWNGACGAVPRPNNAFSYSCGFARRLSHAARGCHRATFPSGR